MYDPDPDVDPEDPENQKIVEEVLKKYTEDKDILKPEDKDDILEALKKYIEYR